MRESGREEPLQIIMGNQEPENVDQFSYLISLLDKGCTAPRKSDHVLPWQRVLLRKRDCFWQTNWVWRWERSDNMLYLVHYSLWISNTDIKKIREGIHREGAG